MRARAGTMTGILSNHPPMMMTRFHYIFRGIIADYDDERVSSLRSNPMVYPESSRFLVTGASIHGPVDSVPARESRAVKGSGPGYYHRHRQYHYRYYTMPLPSMQTVVNHVIEIPRQYP